MLLSAAPRGRAAAGAWYTRKDFLKARNRILTRSLLPRDGILPARRLGGDCVSSEIMKCNNILETIGGTPLVRLNRLTKDFRAEVYVKAD